MEIGISTGFFYEKDLIESLPLIQKHGFRNVELWAGASNWGQYTHYNWHEENYTRALKSKLAETGIKVSSVHAPFSDTVDISNLNEMERKSAVEECCKLVGILKELNGNILVVHPAVKTFDLRDSAEKTRRLEQARKSVGEIAEEAKSKGCKIALENLLPHILGGEIGVLLDLIGDFKGESLGICFDSSHANLWKRPTVSELLEKAGPYLIATHFSDNYGQYDNHHPPGDGEINWPDLMYLLKRISYDGIFMLEVLGESRSKDPDEILSKSYQQSRNVLERAESAR